MTHRTDEKQLEWTINELAEGTEEPSTLQFENLDEVCCISLSGENLMTKEESMQIASLLNHPSLEQRNICSQLGHAGVSSSSSLTSWADSSLGHSSFVPGGCPRLENSLEYLDISSSLSCKPVRNKRKQKIIVRENDQIEFIEGFPLNKTESCRLSLSNIGNSMPEHRSLSPNVFGENSENERKESIAKKLDSSFTYLRFTETEEWDIQKRASSFIGSLKPDTRYCISPTDSCNNSFDNTSMSVMACPCYVVNKHSYLLFSSMPRNRLPVGTQLYKPPRKLVELVALALDESPDRILQVQQVYSYIMLRYPYFAFMDKLSMNSWRSSVRHALYQKWFKKISVSDEKIGSKGCFWAINRENTPREWRIPSQEDLPQLENELEHSVSPASYISPPLRHVSGPLHGHYQEHSLIVASVAAPGNGTIPCNAHVHRPIWQPSAQYKMLGKRRGQPRPFCYGPHLPGHVSHPYAGYPYLWRPAALHGKLPTHPMRPPLLLPKSSELTSSSGQMGHWPTFPQ